MIRRYPGPYLLSFIIAGIVIADRWNLSPYLLLILIAASLGAAGLAWNRRWIVLATLLTGLTCGLFSAFSFSLKYSPTGPNHLRAIISEPTLCNVFGQVADWPEIKPGRTEIVIAVDSLRPGRSAGAPGRMVNGSLLLKVTDTTTSLQRGDRVAFYTRLYPVEAKGRSGFDYGRYLNLRGVFAQAYLPTLLNVQVDERSGFGYPALVDRVRSWIQSSLDQHLSKNASALARGFLIGETRDIPPEIYGMFRDSGTLHLLAVSGSNVALVILFFVWALRPFWFGPTTRALILLAVIAVFAGLSYGDPSVMRASIMASLVLGARLLKRSFDLNNIVAVTALAILLVDPAQLYDVGFQLSFVTAWGLVFIIPLLTPFFAGHRNRFWYRWLVLPFLVVLVAQVCSTPIIAYYFDRIPIISVVANLIIVPLVSLGVLGILLLLMADLIWPLLGAFVGGLLNLVLETVVGLLALMGGENIPVFQTGSLVEGGTGLIICVFVYLLLVLGALALKAKAPRRLAMVILLVAANVGLASAILASTARSHSSLECHAVPGGVAVMIRVDDTNRPDLIITGLQARNYPLDERVLAPLLYERKAGQLNGVFLLSADYDALDDLLRIAFGFAARSFYARRNLAPSLSDVVSRMSNSPSTIDFHYFDGPASASTVPGYYLGDSKITVMLEHTRIDIVPRLLAEHFQPVAFSGPAVLVIGSKWTPAADDWIRLHRAGYDRIVCAKLEQGESSAWPDAELDPDGAPPDYIWDLSRTGFCRVGLPY